MEGFLAFTPSPPHSHPIWKFQFTMIIIIPCIKIELLKPPFLLELPLTFLWLGMIVFCERMFFLWDVNHIIRLQLYFFLGYSTQLTKRYLLFQGTKGLTMFYLLTRNEDGKLNNIEVQVTLNLIQSQVIIYIV